MTAQPEDNDTPDMTPEERAEYLAAFYPDDYVIYLRDKISAAKKGIQSATEGGRHDDVEKSEDRRRGLEQQLKDLLSERRMHGLALVPETAPTPAPSVPPESVVMPVIATPNVAESAPAVVGVTSTESIPPRPVQRQHAQEQAIMHLIREAGHEPLRLPINEPGKPGIKSHVRKLVMRDPIFIGANVFDKAWERLRSSGEIADQH